MDSLLIEATIVGGICWVVGSIIFNLTMNNSSNNNINTCGISDYCIKKEDKKFIGTGFFVTGFVLHLLLQYIGFSKWICARHNAWGLKCLAMCKTID
jgi:hypothetical protein